MNKLCFLISHDRGVSLLNTLVRGGLLVKLELVYMDCFETEFKDTKYCIYRFLEPQSLNIITGTNLNLSFEQYKHYICIVEWKGKKGLKVTSIAKN